MGATFFTTSRDFTLRYAGLSFYWAWVFLSFNSLDITGAGGTELSLVHMISATAALATFAVCALRFRTIAAWLRGRVAAVLIVCSLIAGGGTFLYTSPLFVHQMPVIVLGAALSGVTCSTVVLAWGAAYRGLDARQAVLFTSMTFFGAALLYAVVTQLDPAWSSLVVSFFPLLAAVTVVSSLRGRFAYSRENSLVPASIEGATGASSGRKEFAALVRTALSWRVLVGLLAAAAAYGGLRVYFGSFAPSVFADALLMAAPLALAALIFFVYGMFVSRTSLNLGILYRIALSAWAVAFVVIALLGQDNASGVFFIVSLCSVLFEILTWALLVEITRTTHFSALLVFAVGRLVVHVGIVLGELVAFAFVDDVVVFSLIALCVLLASIGFAFTDRDTTFLFESPTPEELERLVGKGKPRVSARRVSGESDSSQGVSSLAAGELAASAVEVERALKSSAQEEAEVSTLVPHAFDLALRIDAVAEAHDLSPREREVFTLWVTGHGSKYIQEKFVISPATVKTHVRHIYEKCDVHNRAELMSKLEDVCVED